MAFIINAGSQNKGGTLEQATRNAEQWLTNIHAEGFCDVKMEYVGQQSDGDFVFHFTHAVTGKVATLETHGLTKEQEDTFIYRPRVYWNGSSTADPQISDWLADGFDYEIKFFKK